MSKRVQDVRSKKSKLDRQELENEIEFDGDLEFKDEREKIVERSPDGRFIRFNEELGTGAYKAVYRAYDSDSGCEVAWNVIRLQRLHSKERKRISDEINLLKSLRHPNIIHFISAWNNKRSEEVVFITEIVSGGSLKSYLKRIKNPKLKVIKSWCREILQGLEYLHSMKPHPIMHRDLKCDNIFINSNRGEIRIGDLGLATCVNASRAKSVLGTPHFMAPEMYEEAYGKEVDIYSFGMCLLEMVTRQIPYKECENAAQIYKKVITGKKPQSLDLILDDQLKNVILDCLKHKDERPTAKELLQSKFFSQNDESDDYCVKMLNVTEVNTSVKDEKYFDTSLAANLNCFEDLVPRNIEYLELNTSLEKHIQRNQTDQKYQNILSENLPFEESSEPFNNFVLEKDQNGITHTIISQDQPNDHSNFTYKFNIKSRVKSHIYIDAKVENQEMQFFKQKLIRLDSNRFAADILLTEVAKAFEIQMNNSALAQAINKFSRAIENTEFDLSESCSNIQNISYFNANTSCSTVITSNVTKTIDSLNNHSTVRGTVISPKIDNNAYQSDSFISCYYEYLNSIPKEYLYCETEESMNLRHNAEQGELQRAHLKQTKFFLDRRQSCVVNSIPLSSFYDLNSNELEEASKDCNPTGADPISFSPINSGYNTSDEVALNEENFSSHNNSVEIVSIIKKFNSQHQNICEELNKSNLAVIPGETISPNTASLPLLIHQCSGSNTPSQSNSISPNATSESNSQLFGNFLNKVLLQDSCQKQILSPIHKLHKQPNQIQMPKFTSCVHNYVPLLTIDTAGNTANQSKLAATVVNSRNQIYKLPKVRNKLQRQKSLEQHKTVNKYRNKQQVATRCESEKRKIRLPTNFETFNSFNSFNQKKKVWVVEKASSKESPETSEYSDRQTTNQAAMSLSGNRFLQDQLQLCIIKSLSNNDDRSYDSETLREDENLKGTNGLEHNGQSESNLSKKKAKLSSFSEDNYDLTIDLPESSNMDSNLSNENISDNKSTLEATYNVATSSFYPNAISNNQLQINQIFLEDRRIMKNSMDRYLFDIQIIPKEKPCMKSEQLSYREIEKIRKYEIQNDLKREGLNLGQEDVKVVQACLAVVANTTLEVNGHFGHYTEKVLKSYQATKSLIADGIITKELWERMKGDFEKKLLTPFENREREIREVAKKTLEDKKTFKEKQIKDAQECLKKIQSELIDLSTL